MDQSQSQERYGILVKIAAGAREIVIVFSNFGDR
jgi:hypothetical protein